VAGRGPEVAQKEFVVACPLEGLVRIVCFLEAMPTAGNLIIKISATNRRYGSLKKDFFSHIFIENTKQWKVLLC
jgi:hypothetical protein